MTTPGTTAPFSGPLRVLVVVEQKMLCDLIKLTLTHGAQQVRDASSVGEAVALIDDWQPHLTIVEMCWNGGDILRAIGRPTRSGGTRPAVLALTRRGDLKDKLAAFDLGVDDIMAVPFAPEELLARAQAITRRTHGVEVPFHPVLKVGEIEIDILNRLVRVGTAEVSLTGLEQSLLYLLASNPGKVVTREQIAEAIWGPEYIAESNTVDSHVRNLRAKLRDDWRQPRFIATESGKGYRFVPVFPDSDEIH